jgi:hypothetical protein
MDAMVEQTITGNTLAQEQAELTRGLIEGYCEWAGASLNHFSETSGIDPKRLREYMSHRIDELNDREMESFFALADKLEMVKK